ncbi:tRNA dihydrouridine synthase DusB [Fangia hongkongensis]|uniref:tRNA dihydrouridine synthase DusB n=1 Tax=Fangia hongkongensis TaxID=270495 RepID=UPI00035FC9CF|nr:tRNA dihydrouridine synthase DusB [Fangia hongkongensis]MBK2124151.1 tRNA dihydrouridine synthase DusB [Fangia hongkongensis]
MIQIGTFSSENILFLAPMAGVTDLPFRALCKEFGAGWVVSEMVWSHKHLYESTKTQRRLDHSDEISPKIIQIAGGDPELLAEAAMYNVEKGADIIDINMGCPAKKVCNKLAGSALMRDEKLVGNILKQVVKSVDVPVTLKIRTGWSNEHKNALNIARIAENEGIALLTIHGRTREQKYTGYAEYDTIANIKNAIKIPVIANGDITTPEKAKEVLHYTQADGLMIGRGAHGNPWIFSQINDYLAKGHYKTYSQLHKQRAIILKHIQALYHFYGEYMGLRFARKHVGWYLDHFNMSKAIKKHFNILTETNAQLEYIRQLGV